jgi:hypothetical protein
VQREGVGPSRVPTAGGEEAGLVWGYDGVGQASKWQAWLRAPLKGVRAVGHNGRVCRASGPVRHTHTPIGSTVLLRHRVSPALFLFLI